MLDRTKPAYEFDVITQFYTHIGLIAGAFDGEVTVGELKQYGDFGVGTFNGFDGEMTVLDNKVYQAKADGSVIEASDEVKTPYALVKNFSIDQQVRLPAGLNYSALKNCIDHALPSLNIFYAVRIDAVFDYLKLRTIPAQQRPFPSFKALRQQMPMFEHQQLAGTVLGFRCPSYIHGINRAGYHLHFISADRQYSGHLVELSLQSETTALLDHSEHFSLKLPTAADAYGVNTEDVDGIYAAEYY